MERLADGRYEGQFLGNRRHGRGLHVWYATGNRLEGEWRAGTIHGSGTFTSQDGTYKGEWKDGEQHGRGVYSYANGDRFEGEFRGGKRHGSGVYVGAEGYMYDGEWFRGVENGQGCRSDSEARFEGNFFQGKRHGHGVETAADGLQRYEGGWQVGKHHGKGIETTVESTYEGEFCLGRRHGKGVEQWVDGLSYQGDYLVYNTYYCTSACLCISRRRCRHGSRGVVQVTVSAHAQSMGAYFPSERGRSLARLRSSDVAYGNVRHAFLKKKTVRVTLSYGLRP